jgi:hypothetical protein
MGTYQAFGGTLESGSFLPTREEVFELVATCRFASHQATQNAVAQEVPRAVATEPLACGFLFELPGSDSRILSKDRRQLIGYRASRRVRGIVAHHVTAGISIDQIPTETEPAFETAQP